MISMTRRYRFPAAHVLRRADFSEAENQRVYGKCANPSGHGHDYTVEVTPQLACRHEIKFKEELLPLRDRLGGLRSLFSHNSVLDSPAVTLAALGDIARAKGMSQVARDSGLSRESLYKALSGERSPDFETVLKVVGALGLELHAKVANEFTGSRTGQVAKPPVIVAERSIGPARSPPSSAR